MNNWMKTFALSVVPILFGCGDNVALDIDNTPLVKVVKAGDHELKDNLYFPAVANAAERSHLSFRVSGEIKKLTIREGDRVQKGDVLAELDPTDYQLDVDNASAKYSVANSQFTRSKPLVKKGLLAKSQFDELAAQRQIALSEFELAKLRLSFTKLLAPVDGVISRVSADQFENIQVGQQIVNIHSVENVEVLIQLPDRLYVNQPKASVLQSVVARVRVPSGNEYLAKIKEFTTEPDPKTASYTVILTLPMPDDEYILDGMAVEVTAEGQSVGMNLNAGVSIPIEAIFNAEGLDRNNMFVWVLKEDSTVKKQRVVLGKAVQNHIQVLDGLEHSDQIVIAGVSRLRDGMMVKVVQQEADQ